MTAEYILDFDLMLLVFLPVFDKIHLQSNMSAKGVENKATVDSNLITALTHGYKNYMIFVGL